MPLQREYKVVYTVDDAQAKAALAGLTQQFGQVTAAAQTAGESLGGLQAGAQGMAQGFEMGFAALAKMQAQMMLLEGAVETVAAIGDQMQRARKFIAECAEEASKVRDSLREIANLRGKDSPDDQVVASAEAFGLETGLGRNDAREFLEQFEGAIPAARARGNVTPEVEKAIKRETATLAARTGLQPATAAKLGGLLGEYTKLDTPEKGAGQLGQVVDHLNDGVGKLSALAPALIGLMGEMVDEDNGRTPSAAETAAILSASTVRAKSGFAAATHIRQANNALRRFDGNDVKTLKDKELGRELNASEKASLTLQELGITPGDNYLAGLRKVAPKIMGPEGDLWLAQHGFKDQHERRSLIEQAKLLPNIDAQLAKHKPLDIQGGETIKSNENFRESKAGKKRQAQAAEEAQKVLLGMENEDFVTAKQFAGLRRRAQPGFLGSWNRTLNSVADVPLKWAGQQPIDEQNQEREVLFNLNREMKKLGIGTEKTRKDEWDLTGEGSPGKISDQEYLEFMLKNPAGEGVGFTHARREQWFKKYAPLVKARGGDIYGGDAGTLGRLKKVAGERDVAPARVGGMGWSMGADDAKRFSGHGKDAKEIEKQLAAMPEDNRGQVLQFLRDQADGKDANTPADKQSMFHTLSAKEALALGRTPTWAAMQRAEALGKGRMPDQDGWHDGMGYGGAKDDDEMATLEARIGESLDRAMAPKTPGKRQPPTDLTKFERTHLPEELKNRARAAFAAHGPFDPKEKQDWHAGMSPTGARNDAELKTLFERMARSLERIEQAGRGRPGAAPPPMGPPPVAVAAGPRRP